VRLQKKQRKASYFSATTNPPKRTAESEHVESPQRKKVKLAESRPGLVDGTPESAPAARASHKGKERVDKNSGKSVRTTALERLATRSVPAPVPRNQQEKDEDAYIALLEAKLGMNRKGKKDSSVSKEFEQDGLDGACISVIYVLKGFTVP